MFDRIWRFIGSIKLAIPLLSLIVIILIGATFYESQVGSVTVQQEIYQSPWFGGLMFLLAVNLGISALSRYPWRGARKVGFAITHLGLIVIIAGSAAVIHLGMEGMLLVRIDSFANNQIRVQGDLLQVMDSQGEVKQGNIFVDQNGVFSPHFLAGLELEGYSDNAIKTVDFVEAGEVKNPAVKLNLSSQRMGQNIDQSLAVAPQSYSQITLGLAELAIVKTESQGELEQLLSPPETTNQHPWGTIELISSNPNQIIDVQNNLAKTVKLDDLEIKITDFFPDFRLDDNNLPSTASANLNNPTVLLELTSSKVKERWFVFAKADFPPIRSVISGEKIANLQINYTVQTPPAEDYFNVIVTDKDELYYTAKSSHGFKSGKLNVGESVTPGWADFQITLQAYIPHAQLQRKIVPVDSKQIAGSPALLVKTPSGKETWLPWGEPTTMEEPDGEIYASFSPKLLTLPFGVKLEDFIVERNEGSQSVAMWTSQIRIEDPINGVSEQRNVWMNHPTWYHGWKIAQASWNPGDLQQSTLQVKREPTWVTMLTWLGSSLVVIGIAVMFYAPVIIKSVKNRQSSVLSEESFTKTEAMAKPF